MQERLCRFAVKYVEDDSVARQEKARAVAGYILENGGTPDLAMQAAQSACPDAEEQAAQEAKTAVDLWLTAGGALQGVGQHFRESLLLAIGVVYYLRLDEANRAKFVQDIENRREVEAAREKTFLQIWTEEVDAYIEHADIPAGIAKNGALKENFFAIVYKKRNITRRGVVFMDEAGLPEDDRESLKVLHPYLDRPQVSFVAISNHMLDAAKANRAITLWRGEPSKDDLQGIAEGIAEGTAGASANRDISGLAVAYLSLRGGGLRDLRGPSASIPGFDAMLVAKTAEELREAFGQVANAVASDSGLISKDLVIRRGVEVKEAGRIPWHEVANDFAKLLQAFGEVDAFEELYGQRDFVHLIRYITYKSLENNLGDLTPELVTRAVERNFGGCTPDVFRGILNKFLYHAWGEETAAPALLNVVEVLQNSIKDTQHAHQKATERDLERDERQPGLNQTAIRYKMIVDGSEDESIVRLLFSAGILQENRTHLLSLSDFEDDKEAERLMIISEIKAAAQAGRTVVLSQTESIEESFFDLFNQHFSEIPQGGKITYYANVAAGSISKLVPVHPQFNAIVIKQWESLASTPKAELNRFEKFRITQQDVLAYLLSRLGERNSTAKLMVSHTISSVQAFVESIGSGGFYGLVSENRSGKKTVQV
eukprot:g3662.t1